MICTEPHYVKYKLKVI